MCQGVVVVAVAVVMVVVVIVVVVVVMVVVVVVMVVVMVVAAVRPRRVAGSCNATAHRRPSAVTEVRPALPTRPN